MTDNRTVSFITLGCAKNEVDSDKMKAKLAAAGFTVAEDASEADLTIINTCSFLASAVEEGIDVILNALGNDGEGPALNKVLVTGCMPSRYGQELASELPEVAGFLPAGDEDKIVEKVSETLGVAGSSASASSRHEIGTFAYVKISDGCDRFCTYCMIPYIRGRYHSYPLADIDAEVAELVEKGVQEIVFIGQDTGIWGRDLEGEGDIADLLAFMSAKYPDTWFRIMYIQPEGITDKLLGVMAASANVCSYIDIPLQHVNADVLKRMNRTGSKEQILELISRIRNAVPGIMIRTTLMAGFPGETEEQFQELMDFVDEAQLDYAGVFAYSQEEGSKAAEYPEQLEEEVKLDRAQRLLDACDANGFKQNTKHIGETVQVVVEGYELTDIGPEALGRWQGQAPDVDGTVHIPMENYNALSVGDLVSVELTDSFCYELEGTLA